MNLGKPAIITGLNILVNLAFAVSIIFFFLILWSVLVGKTTESDSYGLYLFYSLILLGLARILQFQAGGSEASRFSEKKEPRKQGRIVTQS